eukprot:gene34518-41794_t
MALMQCRIQSFIVCCIVIAYSFQYRPVCAPSAVTKVPARHLSRHFRCTNRDSTHPNALNGLEENVQNASGVPSYLEYGKFGLPTLGVWLLQPILSLIDTAVVGMSAATTIAELSALGPGIGWVDSTSYLFYFMGVATTSLFSAALRDNDEKKSKQVLADGLLLATVFGLFLLAVQFAFAHKAVGVLAGASLSSIPFATQYAQIRSLAAPAALLTIVAQAAFLAAKDSVTPLLAVLVGGVVNVVGDLWLVAGLHQGIRGAAWATTYSQYASTLFLLLTAAAKHPKQLSWSSIASISAGRGAGQFLRFCGPMFFLLLLKSALWTLTTLAVGNAGPVQLAAHQITLNFFLLFCICGDVVSQIAQTFLPYAFDQLSDSTATWGSRARKIVRQVGVMGAALGGANMLLSYAISRFGGNVITKSTLVASQVRPLAPLLALCALPHCLMLGYEGVLIAARDVSFLLRAYVATGCFFVFYQLAARARGLGAGAVWLGMVAFQWARLAVFSARVRSISQAD